MTNPVFTQADEVSPSKMTEEMVIASAKRNVAWGILPALAGAHPKMTPKALCERAYAIADEMIKQGDDV
jgi:hypothetical protein